MSVQQGPVMRVPAQRRGFPVPPRLVLAVLGGVVLALIIVGPPLSVLAGRWRASTAGPVADVAALCVVGAVIAWHRPGNPLGWILLGAGGSQVLSADSGSYSVLDYRMHHGALPFGPVAVLLQPAWAVTFTLLGLIILLYPDGRLPSPRWRFMLWPYLALAGLYLGGALVIAADAIAGHQVHVDAGGTLSVFDHPAGGTAWWGVAQALFFLAFAASWLTWLARQAFAYRHSAGERRLQLKWLLSGAAAAIILAVGGFVVSITVPALNGIGSIAITFGILALPVSLGLGILKFRLYDIDRIISRALAYAIVTGLLVGVYAGLVLLATQVLAIKSPVAVAASTLAVAALFNPLRHRVQRAVDRRFNRARYDADQTVAAFAARLKDAVDLDSVRDDLASVVAKALEPAHVSIWMSEHH
jgi:hypothetical protein